MDYLESLCCMYKDIAKSGSYNMVSEGKLFTVTYHLQWNGTDVRFVWKKNGNIYLGNRGIPLKEMAGMVSRAYNIPFNVTEDELLLLRRQLSTFKNEILFKD